MEFSLRIITTSIILLWSIQTYKCTEGYKPGKYSIQALILLIFSNKFILLFIHLQPHDSIKCSLIDYLGTMFKRDYYVIQSC